MSPASTGLNVAPAAGASFRRLDLDWLRIAAFGLLIPYHVGLLFVDWPYHAKSRHSVPALEPLMAALNPWRLLLLFVIAGVATRMMAAKRPPLSLLRERTLRLLVPLLFGMVVIVPPQAWVQAVEQFGVQGSYLWFWSRIYITGHRLCHRGLCMVMPTWNHLWFLLYLWAYTILLIPAAFLRKRWAPVLSRVSGLLDGYGILVTPIVLFAAARLMLFPRHVAIGAFLGDGYDHAVYVCGFLIGFAIALRASAWETMERMRWPALAVSTAILVVAWGRPEAFMLAIPAYQWIVIIALFGFARRHLSGHGGPVGRYLSAAILPFYTVHQTALVLAAYAIRDWGWPAGAEAGFVVAITILICIISYEIVRRVFWLRPLFGLKLHPRVGKLP